MGWGDGKGGGKQKRGGDKGKDANFDRGFQPPARTLDPGQPSKIPLYDAPNAPAPAPKPGAWGGNAPQAAQIDLNPPFSALPIYRHAAEIKHASLVQNVFCVQGETGCGKSSVVPMLLLEAARETGGSEIFQNVGAVPQEQIPSNSDQTNMKFQAAAVNIAVTQPRRLAAISLAKRVSEQYKEPEVGGLVGYRVGRDGKNTAKTKISFVTTGWLLMYLAHRYRGTATSGATSMKLSQHYTHIVLDEIHERDLDMDLLCLLLKKALEQDPKLRIIIMSATVDATRFLQYFSGGTSPGSSRSRAAKVLPQPIRIPARRFPTWPYFLEDLLSAAPEALWNRRGGPNLEGVIQRACGRQGGGGKSSSKGGAPGGGSRVDVNPALFHLCVALVTTLLKPGVCALIFLPGLSEIEQLHEEFVSSGADIGDRFEFHMLHSIIPHETQALALKPPAPGKAKIVLSTNIAESSITIPDVRYVLDFGVVRKLMLDDERSMLTLVNSWASKATCVQRRGRCGRLHEGTILYLFSRESVFERMREYAEPEVMNVPLEMIYLKSKVLLESVLHEPPEKLLAELMDPPPMDRIRSAAQNLVDLGAIDAGPGGGPQSNLNAAQLRALGVSQIPKHDVSALGRISVFMPVTIQLTKLVVLSWALDCVCDGIVIAAALSTNDVFKLATPQSAGSRLSDFPRMLAENYLVRSKHDAGQFSEPIMYRNLYVDFFRKRYCGAGENATSNGSTSAGAGKGKSGKAGSKGGGKFGGKSGGFNFPAWLDQNCVSASRMQQFTSLVSEIAEKFTWAVPEAASDPKLRILLEILKSRGRGKNPGPKPHEDTRKAPLPAQIFSSSDALYTRLKLALCGAFSPNFVLGEINFTNKNEGKIKKCGLDWTRTCLLQQIKPEEMRDEVALFRFFTEELNAPLETVVQVDGNKAFIECAYYDSELFNAETVCVKQMPLLAQLLHQLSRMPAQFSTLEKSHEACKLGNANHLNGIRWHIPLSTSGGGKTRLMGQPYWRSVLGYMCEMRGELKQHIGVCGSLLGREGPDQVRVSGLSLLPGPGKFFGSLGVLLFLPACGGASKNSLGVEFVLEEGGDKIIGARVGFCDDEGWVSQHTCLNLTFSPRKLDKGYFELLNKARHALNILVTKPTEGARAEFESFVRELGLREAGVSVEVSPARSEDASSNDWLPAPFWDPWGDGSDASAKAVAKAMGDKSIARTVPNTETVRATLLFDVSGGPYQLYRCDELSIRPPADWVVVDVEEDPSKASQQKMNSGAGRYPQKMLPDTDGKLASVSVPLSAELTRFFAASSLVRSDLDRDLVFLRGRYDLKEVVLVRGETEIRVEGRIGVLDDAVWELEDGILDYYANQLLWHSAEKPVDEWPEGTTTAAGATTAVEVEELGAEERESMQEARSDPVTIPSVSAPDDWAAPPPTVPAQDDDDWSLGPPPVSVAGAQWY